MEKREARVYYLQKREDRKAIIVFDAGHAGGDVHIYEHKESRSVDQIEEEVKAFLKVDHISTLNPVWTWVDKKYGHSMSWRLVSE